MGWSSASWLSPYSEEEDVVGSSWCDSAFSGIGTMAERAQMWIAFVQSRPSMQPPLTETTLRPCWGWRPAAEGVVNGRVIIQPGALEAKSSVCGMEDLNSRDNMTVHGWGT